MLWWQGVRPPRLPVVLLHVGAADRGRVVGGHPAPVSDKGAKNFNDGGVISRRIPGEAFKGVNSAEPNCELVSAELVDSFGVAVGDMALLSHLQGSSADVRRARSDPEGPAVDPEGA